MSRVIKASEFKAKCLAVLDEVERTRQAVGITKRAILLTADERLPRWQHPLRRQNAES